VITLRDYGGVLGWLVDMSIGLSQRDGHGCWLVCEVAKLHVTITLQAPSLVEKAKAGPSSLHTTLEGLAK